MTKCPVAFVSNPQTCLPLLSMLSNRLKYRTPNSWIHTFIHLWYAYEKLPRIVNHFTSLFPIWFTFVCSQVYYWGFFKHFSIEWEGKKIPKHRLNTYVGGRMVRDGNKMLANIVRHMSIASFSYLFKYPQFLCFFFFCEFGPKLQLMIIPFRCLRTTKHRSSCWILVKHLYEY